MADPEQQFEREQQRRVRKSIVLEAALRYGVIADWFESTRPSKPEHERVAWDAFNQAEQALRNAVTDLVSTGGGGSRAAQFRQQIVKEMLEEARTKEPQPAAVNFQ